LRAQQRGGLDGTVTYLTEVVHAVRTVSLLCGCARARELAAAPRVLGPQLRGWLDDLGVR
jgi:hypothetical protein